MKVNFGLSNVHFFQMTETLTSGVYSMSYGDPIAVPGAVSLTLDVEDADVDPFYADDGVYYTPAKVSKGYKGELELALIPDALKLALMSYREDAKDVMVEVAESKTVYCGFTFEIDNDEKARKFVYYKALLGQPNLSASTTEGTKTPKTETLPITVLPTNTKYTFGTGADAEVLAAVSSYATPETDATVYANWHTAPHEPAAPAAG